MRLTRLYALYMRMHRWSEEYSANRRMDGHQSQKDKRNRKGDRPDIIAKEFVGYSKEVAQRWAKVWVKRKGSVNGQMIEEINTPTEKNFHANFQSENITNYLRSVSKLYMQPHPS
ncbi:hypothetical protein ACFE04_000025 [Oxalis oulophora]